MVWCGTHMVFINGGSWAGRRSMCTDVRYVNKETGCGRKGEKEVATQTTNQGPSIILAHAIHYRLHDTLACVQDPIFVLTRIIPCRGPLNGTFF